MVECIAGDPFRFAGTGSKLDLQIDVDTRMIENKAESGNSNEIFLTGGDRSATA